MNTEVAVIEQRAATLTASQVRGHVQLIQQVMESVMKEGVHYGVIPGTDKPTLLKAGAEVLMSTFRIAVDPQIEDLSSADEMRYRIRCIGTHQTSGIVMGAGIGECSSNEEKYKWKRTNKREFEATMEDRRRVKYGYNKSERKEFETQQVRTEPADVANTILKMAKKRALIDFTLTALAASDIFNQDLEDMDEDLRESLTEGEKKRPPVQQPQRKSEVDPSKKVTAEQVAFVQKKLEQGNVKAEDFCKHFEIAAVPELPFGKVNDALKWIGEQSAE